MVSSNHLIGPDSDSPRAFKQRSRRCYELFECSWIVFGNRLELLEALLEQRVILQSRHTQMRKNQFPSFWNVWIRLECTQKNIITRGRIELPSL